MNSKLKSKEGRNSRVIILINNSSSRINSSNLLRGEINSFLKIYPLI